MTGYSLCKLLRPIPPLGYTVAAAAEWGTTGIVHGKSCCLMRKRVLGKSATGLPVWVSASQYAVLVTVAGPPPTRSVGSGYIFVVHRLQTG